MWSGPARHTSSKLAKSKAASLVAAFAAVFTMGLASHRNDAGQVDQAEAARALPEGRSPSSADLPVEIPYAECMARSTTPRSGLPLPSQVANSAYEPLLYSFLRKYQYRTSKWVHDKRVRDTGSYAKGRFNGLDYHGTHPAVVIYYSPDVYCWLLGGRKGRLADGAMIIKEMYPPPADRYEGQDPSKPQSPPPGP